MPRHTAACLTALVLLCLWAVIPVRAEAPDAVPERPRTDSVLSRADRFRLMDHTEGEVPDPDGVLTWAEYLAMLCRLFAAEDYWYLNRDRGVTWGAAAWHTARAHGFLHPADDDFPFTPETMWKTPVSRQDGAELLSRFLPPDADAPDEMGETSPAPASDGAAPPPPRTAETVFADFYDMDAVRREAVSRLFDRNLLPVPSDGLFLPEGTTTRRDAAAAALRTLDLVDLSRAGEPCTITADVQDEQGNTIESGRTVQAFIGQPLSELAGQLAPEGCKASYMGGGAVSTALHTYILRVKPLTGAETAQRQAEAALLEGRLTREEYEAADFWLHLKDDNAAKRLLLFQDEDWGRKQVYETGEEARAHMAEVQIPVWNLWRGEKSPGTMTLTVHQALAGEIVEIFTEIFEDPERFPIESAGGFRYQSGTTGEHNNGTAVDLNPDANYQVRDGAAETGTHWTPGEDPLSIPSNGSVVRAFENHGWTWGGADWEGSDDPSAGYHDYMHFSYRGR